MISALFSFLFILTPHPAQPLGDARLNQEFDVRVGERVTIKKEGLKITLVKIEEDSRCPEGVQCIWAGNGKVLLKLSKGRSRPTSMRLNTGIDPDSAAYGAYDVKLTNLRPYPKKDVEIKKNEYIATLIVTRR